MIKNEISDARIKLEDDIRAAIQKALAEFTDKTGLSPHRIEVDMVGNISFGERRHIYLLGSVNAHVRV